MIAALGLTQAVPGYEVRLCVKPGVTGLAQILLPADSDLHSVQRKVAHDLCYVINRGIWLDARLLFATVLKAGGVGPRSIRIVFQLPEPQAGAKASVPPDQSSLPPMLPKEGCAAGVLPAPVP